MSKIVTVRRRTSSLFLGERDKAVLGIERNEPRAAGKQQTPLTARGRFWLGHLERWRPSGLSQAQYGRRQRLSAAALGWWKGRLSTTRTRAEPAAAKNKPGGNDGSFVELTMAGWGGTETAAEAIDEIVLPQHRHLRLGRPFEPERVRPLWALLEGRGGPGPQRFASLSLPRRRTCGAALIVWRVGSQRSSARIPSRALCSCLSIAGGIG